jgi:hypothetical protein
MAELITNPEEAKALEVDLDSTCTKREMATFIQNYFQHNVRPLMQMANQTAFVVNELMDFLSQRGLGNSNHGRYFMSTAEWNEFLLMRKKAHESAAELKKKTEEIEKRIN